MTDEEIEKALTDTYGLVISGDVSCSDVLDYINSLKEQLYQTEQRLAECENGYQATLDLERRMRADDKEQIRQETAEYILTAIYFNPKIKVSPELTATVDELADKYIRGDNKKIENAKMYYGFIEQIRKETAKEVLKKIIDHKFYRCDRYEGEEELVEWHYCVPKEDLQFLIDEYGVEVDNE